MLWIIIALGVFRAKVFLNVLEIRCKQIENELKHELKYLSEL